MSNLQGSERDTLSPPEPFEGPPRAGDAKLNASTKACSLFAPRFFAHRPLHTGPLHAIVLWTALV